MDRVAVFDDAGYLYAGGARSLTGGDQTRRIDLSLDIPAVISFLVTRAEALSKHHLLRIYWYDAAPSNRLSTDHQLLAASDNVKLRLGVLNGVGEQKGVDGRIITDLAELSRNRAFADAVLLGGDEDLRIGVELAQERGARVHLLTIEGSNASVTLRREADTVSVVARVEVENFLSLRSRFAQTGAGLAIAAEESHITAPPSLVRGPADNPVDNQTVPPSDSHPPSTLDPKDFDMAALHEVRSYLAALTDGERVDVTSALKTASSVPSEHDGRLLARMRNALGKSLDAQQKTAMRRILKAELGTAPKIFLPPAKSSDVE